MESGGRLKMNIIQLADGMLSIGGVSRFIYDFSAKLTKKDNKSITAVYEIEENHNWGDESFNIIKLDEKDEDLNKIIELKPDLIIWHVCGRTSGLARELTQLYPTLAIVHSLPCPSGTRLYRDKDEICNIPSGKKCFQNWYTRRCGTHSSPLKAINALKVHNSMMDAMKLCNWVYTISNSMKSYLILEGIEEEKITIFDVSLGSLIVPQITDRVERKNDDPIHILFVGRLSYVKGVQYLIKAVKVLLDDGIKIKCTIVGDGWFKEKLIKLSKDLNLEEVVTFVGAIPGSDVGEWYKAADVVVVPSIYPEPAGLVVPEARSYGKPVIVFNVGGLSEWENYMTGISTAISADFSDLAQTIKQSVENNKFTVPVGNKRVDLVEVTSSILFE